jgi:hypothetical protein
VTAFSLLFKVAGVLGLRAAPAPTALIALAAIVKNELPYLLEWIAFHRAVGVERFFIADNDSSDGTTELLSALSKAGVVDWIARPGQASQLPAYLALMKRYRSQAVWIAFIDADEFITPLDGLSLRPVFDTLSADIGAVCVNWATFGSAGQKVPTNELVIERFPARADKTWLGNHNYKSIVRSKAFHTVSSTPHRFLLRKNFRYAHPDGSEMRQHRLGPGVSAEVVWNLMRLNHYVVKSEAEFELIKRPRGLADFVNTTRNHKFFKNHDCNNVPDAMPDWLISATKAEMEKLRGALRDAGCAEEFIMADRKIAERIQELRITA